MQAVLTKKTIATAAALACAGVIAGCGASGAGQTGGRDAMSPAVSGQGVAQAHVQKRGSSAASKPEASHATPPAQSKSSTNTPDSSVKRRPAATHHTSPAKSQDKQRSEAAGQHKRRESLAHILAHNAAKRRTFVSKSAPGVLKLLGFKRAVVLVDSQGRVVTVLIDASEACGHSSATEGKIRSRIMHGIRFIRSVQVLVGQQDFTSYASANCKPVVLPTASGTVVYSSSGHTGDTMTRTFKITASRWTVTYENDGSFLTMFVLKNGKYTKEFFQTQTTGTGKQTFTGPGTFKLRISASGDWKIEVHD